jgi:nitrogen fixation protein FixH
MSKLLWPGMLIAMVVAIVVMNVIMLVVASSDPSFAVDPAYYAGPQGKQAHLDQRDRNRRLGWSAHVEVSPAADDAALLRARIVDRDGRPIGGATVKASVFHKAHASHVLEAELAPLADGGYVASLPMHRPGAWSCRLTVQRGDDTFVTIEDVVVVFGPGGDRP